MRDAPVGVGFAIILLLNAMTIPASARADDPREKFEGRVYKDAEGAELPYRLLMPASYDPDKKYPLVLFFHGAGERGSDNKKQLVHGMAEFASDKIMADYQCFVVAPQCPDNQQWVDTPWSADSHTLPEMPAPALRQSLELVASLSKVLSIDADRIYVTGLSMGGFGAWDAICRRPELFAAAAPVCGGGDTGQAKRIAKVPVWAFHGELDTAVKTKRSRDMIAALKEAGGSPKYTEYKGVGHDSWSATYKDPEFYKWLFAQKRLKL